MLSVQHLVSNLQQIWNKAEETQSYKQILQLFQQEIWI